MGIWKWQRGKFWIQMQGWKSREMDKTGFTNTADWYKSPIILPEISQSDHRAAIMQPNLVWSCDQSNKVLLEHAAWSVEYQSVSDVSYEQLRSVMSWLWLRQFDHMMKLPVAASCHDNGNYKDYAFWNNVNEWKWLYISWSPLKCMAQLFTRSSAIAEGPHDASCQLKSCQLPCNSAETTYTTSPD